MSTRRADRVRTVAAGEAPERWRDLLTAVETDGTRFVLTEEDRPVGALISRWDFERLQRLEEAWREDFEETLDRIQAAFADVPPDELEQEIERTIAEIRAERRQRALVAVPTP